MEVLGAAAIKLGTQVVKSAVQLWLHDDTATQVADTAVDLIAERIADDLDRRRLKRMFETIVDEVAKRVAKAEGRAARGMPENERIAALAAAAETFELARLDESSLFEFDLDALQLERYLRSRTRSHVSAWALSERGTRFYDWLLRECCSYLLEITGALPSFNAHALTEVLRRESAILHQISDLLERLPERVTLDGDIGFETDYLRQVVKELDSVDLFGATVFKRNRGYPLSVAYISLRVEALASPLKGALRALEARQMPVEEMLRGSYRVFIRGEAGSGKTTLLQWIAVRTALRDLPYQLAEWNNLVPFFIRLRRYADGEDLPRPEQFLDRDVARSLAGEMPQRWVHNLLRAGRAVVLVDGVDELPQSRRAEVEEWLTTLVRAFPQNRYIITSRPAAVAADWLEQFDFEGCDVAPMALPDVRNFVAHWHEAVSRMAVDTAERARLGELTDSLVRAILSRRHLRQLATNPLVCALLCAMNRERDTKLPDNRLELYRIALEMFLERRDSERNLPANSVNLEFGDTHKLLQELAYWMMVNALSDAERPRVLERIEKRLETRRHRVGGSSEEVLEYLLERCGLVREPVSGRIDFIHRSFQEYLAAQAAVEADDMEALAERATDDQWRQTVILAAGMASPRQAEQLLKSLLHPKRRLRKDRLLLDLTALGCMETISDIGAAVAEEVRQRSAALLPPTTSGRVVELARIGEFIFELFSPEIVTDSLSAQHSVALATIVGGDTGFHFIEALAQGNIAIDETILVAAWADFDPVEYARHVLRPRKVRAARISDNQILGVVLLPDLVELECAHTDPIQDYKFLRRLKKLRHVAIALLDEPSEYLTVDLPNSAESLTLRAESAADGMFSLDRWSEPTEPPDLDLRYPPEGAAQGLQVNIDGIDSHKLLSRMVLHQRIGHLVIYRDPYLRDLRALDTTPTLSRITLHDCDGVTSLDGISRLANRGLRSLAFSGIRKPEMWSALQFNFLASIDNALLSGLREITVKWDPEQVSLLAALSASWEKAMQRHASLAYDSERRDSLTLRRR